MASNGDPGSTRPFVIVPLHHKPGRKSYNIGINLDLVNMCERVNAHNQWGPTIMLANGVFYLKGMAKFWIETSEKELSGGWNTCKEELGVLFSKPVGH